MRTPAPPSQTVHVCLILPHPPVRSLRRLCLVGARLSAPSIVHQPDRTSHVIPCYLAASRMEGIAPAGRSPWWTTDGRTATRRKASSCSTSRKTFSTASRATISETPMRITEGSGSLVNWSMSNTFSNISASNNSLETKHKQSPDLLYYFHVFPKKNKKKRKNISKTLRGRAS